MAWRVFDEEGKGQCDIISMDDEVVEAGKPIEVYSLNPDDYRPFRTIVPTSVEQLLVPHIIGGELVIDLPDIKTKKAYIKDQLEHRVWESELRPEMPHVHYVDLTLKVKKCRDDMYESLHGGKI
jgi:nicotinate phosphoribosyltransferase